MSRVQSSRAGKVNDTRTRAECFLHIGAMKSGTTFIQQMLMGHAAALRDDGMLVPGNGKYVNQILAVRDILRMPGVTDARRLEGAWAALVEEIHAWPGRASIISVEQLSVGRVSAIAQLVSSLAPVRVHVLLTVRDLARVLPSTWQENIQNGLTWSWTDFVSSVMGDPNTDSRAGERFWRQHDVAKIVHAWSSVVPIGRIHLVTTPPPGAPPEVLWERFCSVLGLDPRAFPLAGPTSRPASGTTIRRNAGLDWPAAEMLRRVNVALGGSVDEATRLRIVKRGLAKEALAGTGNVPIALTETEYNWTTRRARDLVSDIERSGIDIVGDLDDLIPPSRPRDGVGTGVPAAAELTDAALNAVVALLAELSEHQRRTASGARGRRRGGP